MPRVNHVKKAQQRYKTVPVLDPETRQPKQTPVMKGGVQRTTKRGTPIFMTVTRKDTDSPLPEETCGACREPIKVGSPYKYIEPKSGPYGGRRLARHEDCPTWNVWEYSSSLSARLAEVEHNFQMALSGAESEDDVTAAVSEAAEAVREIAAEKGEAADNIEEGFQHETYQSQELRDQAESLESWADEIEGATFPDFPEPEEQECEECGGDPEPDEFSPGVCETCHGEGRYTPDEPTDEQVEEWRQEVSGELTVVGESPV